MHIQAQDILVQVFDESVIMLAIDEFVYQVLIDDNKIDVIYYNCFKLKLYF